MKSHREKAALCKPRREAWTDPSLGALGRSQPCPHLDFRLPASRTEMTNFCGQSHSVCAALSDGSHRLIHQVPRSLAPKRKGPPDDSETPFLRSVIMIKGETLIRLRLPPWLRFAIGDTSSPR